MNKPLMRLVLCLLAGLVAPRGVMPARAEEPVFSPTGPDAAAYGMAAGYPAGPKMLSLPQSFMVGHFSHFSEKYPHRLAARPDTPSPWRRAPGTLSLAY